MELKKGGRIWREPWSLEKLFGEESGKVKVVFVFEKSHVPEILKMNHFDNFAEGICLKISALPGAVRGVLASSSGR